MTSFSLPPRGPGGRRDLDELIEQLRGINERLEKEVKQAEQEAERADAERAEAARRGELGPDWQAVQRRIDSGRTTVAAVFSGEDTSPEAERLRKQVAENLGRLRDDWETQRRTGSQTTPLDEMDELRRTSPRFP